MLTDAVVSIGEHWEDIRQHLGGEDRLLLARYARDFLGAGDEESRMGAARRLVTLVASAVPASHPVRRALAREGRKLRPAAPDWDLARQVLLPLS